MTKKDVIITVSDKQIIDGEAEKYEITVVGKCFGTPSNFTIEYTEYNGEMNGCDTKIVITGGTNVSVVRKGAYNSEMIFEHEKRHSCHYATPFGSFTLGVYTRLVDFDLNEDETSLLLEYTIDYNTGLASENFMKITVKNKENNNV